MPLPETRFHRNTRLSRISFRGHLVSGLSRAKSYRHISLPICIEMLFYNTLVCITTMTSRFFFYYYFRGRLKCVMCVTMITYIRICICSFILNTDSDICRVPTMIKNGFGCGFVLLDCNNCEICM